MYPNLFYSGQNILCLRNVQNFIDFNFIKTVYELFDNPSYLCKYSFTTYKYIILERGMVSIFPNCVKNVRVLGLSDSVKLSIRLMQKIWDLLNCDKIWDLLSCDLTTFVIMFIYLGVP